MADAYIFVYYECLLGFQRDITSALTQTDVNVDRLTEKARKKGLIPAGHYTRPDSGKLIASREKRIASFVSRCIESVKRSDDLFESFLALLDDARLQHLVRRIRRRLAQDKDQKPKRAKGPPPSEDSGVSTSVKSTSQAWPPLPPIPTTFPSLQSPTHNVEASRQPDRKRLSSATKQRLPDYEAETQEPSLQPLTSPTHSGMSSIVPLEETQENSVEALVTTNMPPRLLPSEGSLLEKRQAKTDRTILQTQNQKLIKEKQALEKKLQEKEAEINKLKADHHVIDKQNKEQIRDLQREMGKDQEELDDLRARTAKLERELEKRDKDNEKLRKLFSDREQQVQNHERELENLRKKLSEEKAKAEKKEIQIKELNNKLLQKEVEKLKILDEYKDKERALERERDNLKVELACLWQEMIEKDYKEEKELRKKKEAECVILQQEKEAEECKRRAAEQDKEEEERKRRVAEQEKEEEESKRRAAEQEKEEEESKRRAAEQEKEEEESKRRVAEQEKEEEESKRRVAEQERDEEEIRRKVAEKGHRKSLAELNELKEKFNLKDTQ